MKKFILAICLISSVFFVAVGFPEQRFTLTVLSTLAVALTVSYLLAQNYIQKQFSNLDERNEDI
ncbi:hypothetical protein [Alteromonas mediterranea]|jgi:hypothetical protein|uniref:hypothetical protein n=1 Tax=Alteromonas mediterranea TaxID=314275 RepID=UPI002FE0CE5C